MVGGGFIVGLWVGWWRLRLGFVGCCLVGGSFRVGLWVAMVTILFLLNLDFWVICGGLVVI